MYAEYMGHSQRHHFALEQLLFIDDATYSKNSVLFSYHEASAAIVNKAGLRQVNYLCPQLLCL